MSFTAQKIPLAAWIKASAVLPHLRFKASESIRELTGTDRHLFQSCHWCKSSPLWRHVIKRANKVHGLTTKDSAHIPKSQVSDSLMRWRSFPNACATIGHRCTFEYVQSPWTVDVSLFTDKYVFWQLQHVEGMICKRVKDKQTYEKLHKNCC